MGASATTSGVNYIFDLDGTLISLPVAWDEVRSALRSVTETSMDFNPFFLDIQVILAKRPELRHDVLKTIDHYESLAVPQATLKEGALESLTKLADRASLSLVTMQGAAACAQILRRLDISKFFVSKFTREDSMDRPTQLGMAIDSLGASKEKAVFVGDRINDLNAARSVGVKFVMIRSRPDSPPADALYRSVKEFAESPWVRG
ncbi:MAG: HAD family hydrolase [Thaumarchaeota archaeon]|nr:HAD family hydrolase [Nitrososphaerota archaeon]